MKQSEFPPNWDEERVKRVLAHYEEQTEEEAVVEDEAAMQTSAKQPGNHERNTLIGDY